MAALAGMFTGLGIDTHNGRFHMLPENLIARVRCKALHYGCAIPFCVLEAPVAEARAWVGIGLGRTRLRGRGCVAAHGPGW